MPLTRDAVINALRTVQDPELFKDIVSLNMLKEIRLDGDDVWINIELTTPACPLKDRIEKDVKAALKTAGAREVTLELSANTRGPVSPRKDVLPQVKNVVAVGAGKGGGGKSTVALNRAVGR